MAEVNAKSEDEGIEIDPFIGQTMYGFGSMVFGILYPSIWCLILSTKEKYNFYSFGDAMIII